MPGMFQGFGESLRNVGRGLREGLKVLNQGLKAFAKAVVRAKTAVLVASAAAAREYREAILRFYDGFSGNQAITLSDKVFSDMPVSKRVLHLFTAAWLFAGLLTIASHSIQSFIYVFRTAVNLLPPQPIMKANQDKRPWLLRFTLGGPGLLLGLVPALLGIMAVAITLSLYHTGLAILRAVLIGVNDIYIGEEEQFMDPDAFAKPDYRFAHVLGLLGFGLGYALGLASAFLARLAYHSAKSFLLVLMLLLEPVLPDEFFEELAEESSQPEDNMVHDFDSPVPTPEPGTLPEEAKQVHLVFRAPGLLLGAIIGLLAAALVLVVRILTNSLKTAWNILVDCRHYAWHGKLKPAAKPGEQAAEELPDARRKRLLRKYGLGFLGLLPGIVFGTVALLLVGAGRLLFENAESYLETLRFLMQKTSSQKARVQQETAEQVAEKRSFLRKYIVGGPGAFFGAFTALLLNVMKLPLESFFSIQFLLRKMMALMLSSADAEEYLSALPEEDDRHPARKILLGGLGYVFGVVLGGFAMLGIALGRTVTNNVSAFLLGFHRVYRHIPQKPPEPPGSAEATESAETSTSAEIPVAVTHSRHWLRKVIGSPGFAFGILIGAIAYGAYQGGQYFRQNGESFLWAMTGIIDLALPASLEIKHQDSRSLSLKLLVGGFGALAGALAGGLAVFGVLAFRLLIESAKSTANRVKRLINIMLPEQLAYSKDSLKEERRLIESYVFGLPGHGLGFLLGAIGMFGIGVARVLHNTALVARRIAVNLIAYTKRKSAQVAGAPPPLQLVQSEEAAEALKKEQQARQLENRLGFLGYPFGFLLGLSAMGIIYIGRVIQESTKTAFLLSLYAMNLFLHKEDGFSGDLQRDFFENKVYRFGFGGLGLLPGAVFAAVAALVVIAVRIISNTIKTSWFLPARLVNLILHKEDEFKPKTLEDLRSKGQKYGWGLPAFLFMPMIACLAVTALVLVRIFSNSAKALFSSAAWLIELASGKKESPSSSAPANQEATEEDLQRLAKNRLQKYGLGFVGAILGLGIGGLAGMAILLVRWTVFNLRNFRDVSGGILNLVFGRKQFDALSNKSSTLRRLLGFPGGFLAFALVGSAALSYWLFRSLLPPLLGICFSPLFGLVRASREAYKYLNDTLRFSGRLTADQQTLKNIFANLTAMGNLPENTVLQPAAEEATYTHGMKVVGKFLRKALSFNAQSTTERLLSKLALQVKRQRPLNNELLTKLTWSMKAELENEGCFLSTELEKDQYYAELDYVQAQIADYIEYPARSTGARPKADGGYKALFFGSYQRQRRLEQEAQQATELMPF